MHGLGLLSFLTWAPIAGGLLVLLIGEKGIKTGRWVALATAVVVFAASIPLWTHFNPATFTPKTTHSRHTLGYSPNLLPELREPLRVDTVWGGDIPFLPLSSGGF